MYVSTAISKTTTYFPMQVCPTPIVGVRTSLVGSCKYLSHWSMNFEACPAPCESWGRESTYLNLFYIRKSQCNRIINTYLIFWGRSWCWLTQDWRKSHNLGAKSYLKFWNTVVYVSAFPILYQNATWVNSRCMYRMWLNLRWWCQTWLKLCWDYFRDFEVGKSKCLWEKTVSYPLMHSFKYGKCKKWLINAS